MTQLRLVTWNINSIRLRLPLLERLANETHADIIVLQETKCPDEAFPLKAIHKMGYVHTAFHGMKSYNGVAILSKLPLHNIARHDRVGKQDCRHIAASIQINERDITLHNLYIPAGGDIPDVTLNDKFAHKLDFVKEMAGWFQTVHTPEDMVIALGDFNIAPFEHDVWSHKQLLDVVSHTPIEVSHLQAMQESLRWVDIARDFVPATEKLYSWWSYRNRDWRVSNRGRRLDHIWATPPARKLVTNFQILPDVRDWPQPSDHVPVIIDISY